MNSRERVLAAINIEEPDRVPFSIGLHHELAKAMSEGSEINLMRKIGVDIVSAGGTEPAGWEPKKFPDGKWIDEWGILRNPRVPGSIDWFETHPISTSQDLDNYEFPDPHAPGRFDALDQTVEDNDGKRCVFFSLGWTLFERSWLLHGFEDLLKDMYMNRPLVERLMDKIVDYDIEILRQGLERDVDVCHFGDDLGSRQGPLISPILWRRFIKPRLSKIFEVPKKRGLPISIHSDGNITPLIPDLVDLGVRVINPVSPVEVDPIWLKREFGDRICLYGTIDIHRTMPFGTPSDVTREVVDRMRTVGYDGGLIIYSRSELADTPIENIHALIEAVKRYGYYPLSRS
jgi:uroporphyrinogen decarboxylase